MSEIDLTSPALLFPAVSLLLLAYTNRFLALAALIRSLHASYKKQPDDITMGQIRNLRLRLSLIRNMQASGVASIFGCVLCMLLLFAGQVVLANIIFGLSLLCLMASLALSFSEIVMSVHALNLQLSDLEGQEQNA